MGVAFSLSCHWKERDRMIESDYLKDNSGLIQKLKQIPTLEPFDDKDLQGALQLSKIRKYEPGELILEEGSYDNWIYFLVSGKVRIAKHGKELSVLRRKGDVFGEMGVIDGSARSASAYAIDETVCLVIDASYIDRLSGNDRLAFCYILYRVFSECLANRLRLTNEELIKAKQEIARLRSGE
jgi:CRP-like cAMP-binding protein